ncbi:MAG: RluA family pseudouridine synthase [Geobacteraceae bacterium]|nr:RluA family pseudouridine synthase [Geobacteraceae bacterium]
MRTTRQSAPKHQPKGVSLLYEDADILVVDKPCGLLTMGTDRDKSRTVHSSLNDYVRKGNPKSRNRVYIVHRLDRDTSGILLFAKSEQAKIFLQSDWENTTKIYLAAVFGHITPPRGIISSYLTENAAFTVYSTPDPAKGKLSQTAYTVVKEQKGLSLLRIHLLTGRKHQIRVHLSEKGHPVVGDRKYGSGHASYANLALHACSISFTHPVSGTHLRFETQIPSLFTRLVGPFQLSEGE